MPRGEFDSLEIDSHATLTRQRAEELEQAIDALRAAAGQLAAVWTTPAGMAFQAQREQWERSVKPLQESLHNMSNALSGASSAYDQTEQSISKAFGG
jgi:WXG100 family type VII secretion target